MFRVLKVSSLRRTNKILSDILKPSSSTLGNSFSGSLLSRTMSQENPSGTTTSGKPTDVDSSAEPILGPDGKPLSKRQLKRLAQGKLVLGEDGSTDKAAAAAARKKAREEAVRAAAAAKAEKEKAKKEAQKFEFVNTTPAGEKKSFDEDMLPAYQPKAVEAAWDAYWAEKGFYTTDPAKAEAAGEEGRFVMVLPPPNVTGSLHLGHALTASVEDALARWHRMSGRPTMWLPGMDHAGIATQTVVERKLIREKGLSRHDLGREAFLEEVWKYKNEFGGKINQQLRQLGISADWSRERFTLDEGLNKAVVEAFVRLYEKNLIYRDNRLVNWCCSLRSAISDIEVDYLDFEKATRIAVPGHDPSKKYEFGCITSFAYKVADSPEGEELVVATTRPETMLGDTAVAVHPEDPRYKHLHGKFLVHPFDDRRIPIITDSELVDMSFGTGAVKITPAHDPNDFLCGKKHDLEFINVFTDEGKVNERGGKFAGLMRFDARDAVIDALKELDLYRGKADNKMRLGVCSRTGDVIEPMIKPQWYVKCDNMAKRAADAVRQGDLKIIPESHESTWFSWMDNCRDWCISRQLWWGHRIPAYFAVIADQPAADNCDPHHWIVARTEEEAKEIAVKRFNVPADKITLEQDEDVLDTWFSSGIFPFSTFGWPNTEHPDYKAFYPNSIIETGWDILFFWVARMIMMGLELTDQLPFKTIYLHAIIRDKYGRKMSKSLGNVIDPEEVIQGCDLEVLHEKIRSGNLPPKEVELAVKGQKLDYPKGIPECGADALRFGLLAYTLQPRDINLEVNRIVGYRQFCNKLWNATRFALMHLTDDKYKPIPVDDAIELLSNSTQLSVRDKWILSRLNHAIETVEKAFQEYDFASGTTAIYDFFLYELCDYYLELLKPLMNGEPLAAAHTGGDVELAQTLGRTTLHVCLEMGFRLLHPMMPFVTEELWNRLPGRGLPQSSRPDAQPDPESIMIAKFPTPIPNCTNPGIEADFDLYKDILRAGRSLRANAEIPPSRKAVFYIVTDDENASRVVNDQLQDLISLMRGQEIKVVSKTSEVEDGCSAAVVNDRVSIHLLLKGLVDPKVEIAKLNKRAAKLEKEIQHFHKKMAMPNYTEKVPAQVQERDKEQMKSSVKQSEAIKELISQYEKLIV